MLRKFRDVVYVGVIWMCVISLLFTSIYVYANNNTTNSLEENNITENIEEQNEEVDYSSIYENEVIKIYNLKQLQAIGTNAVVTLSDNEENTFGTGESIYNDNNAVTYSLSAKYQLMNNIDLDNHYWSLPQNFTGEFSSSSINEKNTLYDDQTDTIYIYNNYQLKTLLSDSHEQEPVMSKDMLPEYFGVGQLIYPNNSKNYLTYSSSHHYVLAKEFTEQMPEAVANQVGLLGSKQDDDSIYVDKTNAEGRDFKGQVTKTIDGTTYILIGNEQQLRKIGSDDIVHGAVYQSYYDSKAVTRKVDTDQEGNPILLYPGDADLTKEQNGVADFTFGSVHNIDKSTSSNSPLVSRHQCAVNQDTGEIEPKTEVSSGYKQKYLSDANYIIFRDIDLSSSNWQPLMFQGTMIGAKSINNTSLWNENKIQGNQPILSNINIIQSTELDVGKQIGVGFFATLSNESSDDDIGLSKGTVKVTNIEFNNVIIDNQTSKTKFNQTLISGLTSSLGLGLGGLLDGLTWLLTFGSVDAGLRKTLSNILNARQKDPTALATGVFAGRIVGDVEISKCEINNAIVSNVNNYTGGFAGYVSGKTEYDGLSKGLGGTATLLAKILNGIPGLGLGDLITILLGNAIPVDKLIPTGYKNVVIQDCMINGLTGTIGSSDHDSAGGFIGEQRGTIVSKCSILNGSYQVKANNYSGGFAGIARDDVIEGTLSGALDIQGDLSKFSKINPESMLVDCSISGNILVISGNEYQGGFAGVLANTSAVNCYININQEMNVDSGGNNVGGFAGIADLGWAADLGKSDTKDNLLGGVVDLVVKLLSSDPSSGNALLSLAGIHPSHLFGCQINAPLTVSGKDYVGGFIGRGNGVQISSSNQTSLSDISFIKNGIYTNEIREQKNSLNNIKSVSGDNYVGGLAGSVGTASVAGLLNTTLGVASYLGFDITNVSLVGDHTKIEANKDIVGGAFGEAIGGKIDNVQITNLESVRGNNYVGGFVGVASPGDLVGTDGGLTVNLLGLNHLIKLSNLLSLGQAIEVKITNSNVTGIESGLTIEATGQREENSVQDYVVGGFVARSGSTKISNSIVKNLKYVKTTDQGGYAGGFVGISKTGGLAEVGDETEIKSLIEANGLLNAVAYLIPKYEQCRVEFVKEGQVIGDLAGGFAADFQSGTLDDAGENRAVNNIEKVSGRSYAGGFAGKVYAGALADASKGISILGGLTGLNIQLNDLLKLVNVYVPIIKNAGVHSEEGLVVNASGYDEIDLTSGSAGGYIGYASAVQITNSDVSNLKHTTVTPPSKDLNSSDGSSYYNGDSYYAVSAQNCAGGFVGKLDIGNTASLGKGLTALGSSIELNNLLSALDVVASKIENCDVTGNIGGYSVKANGSSNANGTLGKAGGFVGENNGSQLQNCNAYNFAYVIGQISAGGYVGSMQPGDVASVLGDTTLLGGLVNISGGLASILQSFIPMIYNSQTTCIPCGGVVRASSSTQNGIQKGCAGGYVGYNLGGRIEGNSSRSWNNATPTVQKENSISRLRAVYGYEFAGGFSGKSECANVVDTGGISLLYGLVKLDNTLSALQAVYPTETSTAIYGPLRNLSMDTWNAWVQAVGINGSYGKQLQELGTVTSQEELDQIINKYAYGYSIKAGRKQSGNSAKEGGVAGGYVGQMDGGVIKEAKAMDLKEVNSLRSSGGFVGEMLATGVADVGKIDLAGLTINGDLPILQSFIPVIESSKVIGYQSGASIQTTGVDSTNNEGNSGGYVGKMIGGKILGSDTSYCSITNLKSVTGSQNVGGYIGISTPGSAVTLNTTSNSGLLSKILGVLIQTPASLAQVLNATLSTINYASVSSWNDYGITIDGTYVQGNDVNTSYAPYVGGFIGNTSGTIIGSTKSTDTTIKASGIRKVIGGQNVGGFFGLADVSAIAQVGDSQDTSILNLIQLGNIDVLDSFRTYIYYATVTGSTDNGLVVEAKDQITEGILNAKVQTGNAGGFGGSLLDGSVKNSKCEQLNRVIAKNYAGGFIGHMGKSGVVDLDKAQVLGKLLNATAGVLDVFGSHTVNCEVKGYKNGFTVQSKDGDEPISGGFVGYGDLARISNCQVNEIKKVSSDQIAGGFIGKTSYEYLGDIDVGSTYLLDPVLAIVNKLLDLLYIGDLENLGLIDLNLGSLLQLQIFAEGNTLSVTLLGLKIAVALDKDRGDGSSDLAKITIGDSYIEIPCSNVDGNHIGEGEKENIKIGLIKANRTKVENSTITGIKSGYDVFGGKATDTTDGTDNNGLTGGFIGFNNEGLIENNSMYYADTIRGTSNEVGPFTGKTKLESSYTFNTKTNIEGNNNTYRIYRIKSDQLLNIIKGNLDIKKDSDVDNWNIFKISHYQDIKDYDELKNAKLSNEDKTEQVDLDAYVSNAKAVLMDDTKVYDNVDSLTPIPSNQQDPCDEFLNVTINKIWKDLNNLGQIRPDTIEVTLQRSYMKGSEEITETVGSYMLSSNDATNKNVWQKVINDLPTYTVLDDESKAYYTYTVTEQAVASYTTTITSSNDNYTFTITNKTMSLLPDLGGKGIKAFVLVGIFGVLMILLSYNKSEKIKMGEQKNENN